MAIVTQGSQATIKPDIFDVLMGGDMSWDPSATPLFSALRKGPDTPNAALFQFPYDIPDDPSNTGSAEGGRYAQASTTTYGGRALLYGRMHHKKAFFGVGEVAEGNEVYATNGADEFTYQMRRALRQLVKSMEYLTVGVQESQAGNGTTTFVTRGLENWIVATAGIATQTDTATIVPANFRPAAAQIASLTVTSSDYPLVESQVNNVFNSVYDVLKDKIDYDVHCTSRFKSKVSQWGNLQTNLSGSTQVRRFNQSAESMKIIATIEEWIGDAGKARFALHPWLRFDTAAQYAEALGLDYRFVQYRARTAPKARRLPDAGGGPEGVAEFTMGVQCMPKYLSKWVRDTLTLA
jgi:hypothetical protein